MSHVFISYSRADQDYARKLADKLLELGFDVWIDDRIDFGDEWELAIFDAIDRCAAILVVMTPDSYESRWVRRECQYAEKRNKQPFPVLLKGEEFPRFGITQYVDVRDGALPNDGFYERLAKNAPRKPKSGDDVTEAPNQVVTVEERAQHAAPLQVASPVIELPPPPDVSGILPPPFEWCYVPAGKVTIEYSETDKQAFDIAPFYMAKYPITNAQFGKFIKSGGYNKSDYWTDAGWEQKNKAKWVEPRFWRDEKWNGADYPVVGVSWYEAMAFSRLLDGEIQRAQHAAPLQVMLPDEKQWQRAAQGDDGWVYPWGNEFDVNRCNTQENGKDKTTPVKQYPSGASPFGVMDMSGNVWEWCLTRYSERDEVLEGTDVRVLRGGSWYNYLSSARAAYRNYNLPNDRASNFGFRLVVAAPIRSGL